MRKFDIDEIRKNIVESSRETSVYIGCDSQAEKMSTIFGLAVILHIDSSRGGRCFAKRIVKERRMLLRERLMKEVELAVDTAFHLSDVIGPRNFEIHLDINPKREHRSNVVVNQATGYVSAQGFQWQVKPAAFAASTAADYIIS
jgi:predicted RNase H-related nuclease YkuK (DUF458 family)